MVRTHQLLRTFMAQYFQIKGKPLNQNGMKTTNESIIEKLNQLVEINNDRIEGYERAEKETDETDLLNNFREMAGHSRQNKEELSLEIRALGGIPADGTSTSGKIFRVWMDIKAALAGRDRKAIISSCERGEDTALDTYKEVLGSDVSFPSALRDKIKKQEMVLRSDHDHIKALRDSAKAQKQD